MRVRVERIIKDDFLGIAVMHMMTEATKKGEDFCQKFNVVAGGNSEVELALTVNGVPVDFEHFMDELKRQHERMVEHCARQFLKDRGLDGLYETLEALKRNIEEKIEEVFPGYREERW